MKKVYKIKNGEIIANRLSDRQFFKDKLSGIVYLYGEAITIIEKHIKQFKECDLQNNKKLIDDLEHGRDVLLKHKKTFIEEGVDGLISDFKRWYKLGQIPGLGLSKGFGGVSICAT